MRLRWLMIFSLLVTAFLLSPCSGFATDEIEGLYLRSDYPAVIEEGARILSSGAVASSLDKVYFYLGLSNMKLGNFSEARNDFKILLRDFSGSQLRNRANLALGDTYFLEENYSEANKVYEQLAEENNSDILSLVFYRLTQVNTKLGNWQQAKSYLDKLKNDFPQSFEAGLAANIVVAGEFFTVQVGSFIDLEKAKKVVDDLKADGFAGYIEKNASGEKTFYRVRVGKLISPAEAKELEQKLAGKNYPTKIFP